MVEIKYKDTNGNYSEVRVGSMVSSGSGSIINTATFNGDISQLKRNTNHTDTTVNIGATNVDNQTNSGSGTIINVGSINGLEWGK